MRGLAQYPLTDGPGGFSRRRRIRRLKHVINRALSRERHSNAGGFQRPSPASDSSLIRRTSAPFTPNTTLDHQPVAKHRATRVHSRPKPPRRELCSEHGSGQPAITTGNQAKLTYLIKTIGTPKEIAGLPRLSDGDQKSRNGYSQDVGRCERSPLATMDREGREPAVLPWFAGRVEARNFRDLDSANLFDRFPREIDQWRLLVDASLRAERCRVG